MGHLKIRWNQVFTCHRPCYWQGKFFLRSFLLFLLLLLPQPLTHASSTWTQTTDVDFNAGTKNRVIVNGTGAGGAVVLDGAHFSYKRPITIDNSSGAVLTDYQVRIALDGANFDFSKAEPDGDDIRFLDSDDTTLVPYWIESWDGVGLKAVIWVKVPSIPAASTKTILMYYGSSSAGGESNGVTTFDIFDDFDNLVGWNQSGSVITVNNGTLTLDNVTWGNPSIWKDFAVFSPCVVEVKYRHPSRYRNRLYFSPVSGWPQDTLDTGGW